MLSFLFMKRSNEALYLPEGVLLNDLPNKRVSTPMEFKSRDSPNKSLGGVVNASTNCFLSLSILFRALFSEILWQMWPVGNFLSFIKRPRRFNSFISLAVLRGICLDRDRM